MTADDLALALVILRNVRGWTQSELADASAVRNTSISDYETGRKTPELRTLQRLVGAMGYPLSAVDHTSTFVYSLRTQSFLVAGRAPSEQPSAPGPAPETDFAKPAVLHWEAEQVSAEVGRTATRFTRLFFALLSTTNPSVLAVDSASSHEPGQ